MTNNSQTFSRAAHVMGSTGAFTKRVESPSGVRVESSENGIFLINLGQKHPEIRVDTGPGLVAVGNTNRVLPMQWSSSTSEKNAFLIRADQTIRFGECGEENGLGVYHTGNSTVVKDGTDTCILIQKLSGEDRGLAVYKENQEGVRLMTVEIPAPDIAPTAAPAASRPRAPGMRM